MHLLVAADVVVIGAVAVGTTGVEDMVERRAGASVSCLAMEPVMAAPEPGSIFPGVTGPLFVSSGVMSGGVDEAGSAVGAGAELSPTAPRWGESVSSTAVGSACWTARTNAFMRIRKVCAFVGVPRSVLRA